MTSTTVKNPGGTIVRQQSALFDELGRLMKAIGAASQTTILGYDRTDNLTSVTDPRSNLFAYAYDALQRLIRTTDQESNQVNVTLNAQDKVTAYQDPRNLNTSYVRNGFGDVIQEGGPDVGATALVRDLRGLVTQMTDPRGIVANFGYDNAGRLQSVSYPASSADNVTYSYDATSSGNKGVGRLTGIGDGSGSTTRIYDPQGRIVSETRMITGNSYATTYAYDAASYLTQITYPSGRIVTYGRNNLGQVTSVTTQQNAMAAYMSVVNGVSWMPMSNLIAGMTHGNGLVTAATYDQDYRLTGLAVTDGAATVSSLAYGYTDGINLTAVNDNVTSANSVGLSYTPANRLATATGPWGSTNYGYDGVGNRLTEVTTSGTTTTRVLRYPGTSNLLSGITENSAALRSYAYDAAGNIVTDTRPGEVYGFTYNVRNRPTAVTRNSAAWASYAYNALEQMVSRSTSAPGGPSGTVQYIYDLSGHLIAEADAATGATLREYIWLAANDNGGTSELPLAVVDGVSTSPVLYLVHADHLGRPIRVRDASTGTVWQAAYKPFGEVQSLAGTAALDLRFPGQFFEIETGLAYNWHRHYDPLTGRYTQPDPLRFVDGPSVFAYAGGSPNITVDPKGLYLNTNQCFIGESFEECQQRSQLEGGGGGGGNSGGGISEPGFGKIVGAIAAACFDAMFGSGGKPPKPPKDENPREHAYESCKEAAGGNANDWINFCNANKFFWKFDKGRSARCYAEQFSSVTRKLNWCYNEFGEE